MPKIIVPVLVLLLLAAAFALPPSLTPAARKSPEFIISNPSDPSGKTTLLSSLKGKVVVLDFWFIQSDHCLRVAKMLNKLNGELAPRGFQALGVVFDPPNVRGESGGRLIQPTVNYLKLAYPVGFATKDQVDSYLGRTPKEMLSIPQIVVIDRAGMIRATTGTRTDPTLEDENSLRALLDGLLKESPPPGTPAKTPAKSKKIG
ncbi:MAG TPA: TlpA disulfide reductase family protein [Candidatus Angelobacter sp.]